MTRLESYLCGRWIEGSGAPSALLNPTTEEPLGEIAAVPDLAEAVAYGREKGGEALRELTFRQRGELC